MLRVGRARGDWSLLQPRNKRAVDGIVRRYAARFRVRVMQLENVGNHLHLLVQASRREDFRAFMRTVPAQIATKVTGARKGKALKRIGNAGWPDTGTAQVSAATAQLSATSAGGSARKFWDGLAYSRVVHWGRDLLGLRHYLTKNAFEGEGIELLTTAGVVRRFFIKNGRLIV